MEDERVIQAVYENGVLRPLTPLAGLADGQAVSLVIRPVVPAVEESKRREAAFLRHLDALGLLERVPPPAQAPPADWQPLAIEGEPLSETVIRLRGER